MPTKPPYTIDKLGRVDRAYGDRLMLDCLDLGFKPSQLPLLTERLNRSRTQLPRLTRLACERLRLVRHLGRKYEAIAKGLAARRLTRHPINATDLILQLSQANSMADIRAVRKLAEADIQHLAQHRVIVLVP